MGELKGFRLAIELAERQRDAYAKVFAQAQRDTAFGQQQLTQLQSYAGDTDARWTGHSSIVLSAETIRHHYQFVERLQQAIGMQKSVIANLSQHQDSAQQALLLAERRLGGLREILKKRMAAVARTEQRREQAQMDEMASALHRRTQTTSTLGGSL
jgi:flagellar FliJ protein